MSKNDAKKGPSLGQFLGISYVVGFLVTAGYYVISGFSGCPARTVRGSCFDFELFIEALVFSLIWPLHWLLEIVEALAK